MAQKVAQHVQELAKSSRVDLEAYEVAARHLDIVKDHAGDAGDISGIFGAVCVASGLRFEKDGSSA